MFALFIDLLTLILHGLFGVRLVKTWATMMLRTPYTSTCTTRLGLTLDYDVVVVEFHINGRIGCSIYEACWSSIMTIYTPLEREKDVNIIQVQCFP